MSVGMQQDIAETVAGIGGYRWFPDPQFCALCNGFVTVVEDEYGTVRCNECGKVLFKEPDRQSFLVIGKDNTILYAIDSTTD